MRQIRLIALNYNMAVTDPKKKISDQTNHPNDKSCVFTRQHWSVLPYRLDSQLASPLQNQLCWRQSPWQGDHNLPICLIKRSYNVIFWIGFHPLIYFGFIIFLLFSRLTQSDQGVYLSLCIVWEKKNVCLAKNPYLVYSLVPFNNLFF